MNKYEIAIAGSVTVGTVYATCISKACKSFIETLEKEAEYNLITREHATIRYTDNYSICSDFVVMKR